MLALPGNFGNTFSAGCNYLIKSHKANLIEGAADLVKLLNWGCEGKKEKADATVYRTDKGRAANNGYYARAEGDRGRCAYGKSCTTE